MEIRIDIYTEAFCHYIFVKFPRRSRNIEFVNFSHIVL